MFDRIAARQKAAGLGRDRRLLPGQTGHGLVCGTGGLREEMTPSRPEPIGQDDQNSAVQQAIYHPHRGTIFLIEHRRG
jgi:hypothetical protein